MKKIEEFFDKISPWIYGFAMIGAMVNAYSVYVHGNQDAFVAWMCAGGMAGGAMSASVKLKENRDEDNIS